MGRPAEQIEQLQARVAMLEGRNRAYSDRIGALRRALGSIAVHAAQDDAMVASGALANDDESADASRGAPMPPVLVPAAVPPVLVAGEVLDEPRCGKPDPEGRACTLAADHARPDDHDGKPGPYTGAAALVMGGPLPPLLADEDDA